MCWKLRIGTLHPKFLLKESGQNPNKAEQIQLIRIIYERESILQVCILCLLFCLSNQFLVSKSIYCTLRIFISIGRNLKMLVIKTIITGPQIGRVTIKQKSKKKTNKKKRKHNCILVVTLTWGAATDKSLDPANKILTVSLKIILETYDYTVYKT